MSDGPRLPEHVTIEQIEAYLDRVSLAVACAQDPAPYLLWYEFLEKELELKRRAQSSVCSALERAKRAQIERS